MMDWEAHLVQRPWQRPGVALLFAGERYSYAYKLMELVNRDQVYMLHSPHQYNSVRMLDAMVCWFNLDGGCDGVMSFVNDDTVRLTMPSGYKVSRTNSLRVIVCLGKHRLRPVNFAHDNVIVVSSSTSSDADNYWTTMQRFYEAANSPSCMDAYYNELMRRDISSFAPCQVKST